MEEIIICASADDADKRLDAYLSEKFVDMSRNAVQSLIADGNVKIDNKVLKKNYKLNGTEEFRINLPALKIVDIQPEDIPLDIVYEDNDIIVINKPKGMVVHPAVGNWSGTMVNALMHHCGDSLSGINGEIRPGIVHRIDKDTSGLIVVAKNDKAHQSLAEQIKEHSAGRVYQAIVMGGPREDEGTINKPIARHKTDRKKMAVIEGGREAITHYKVICRYSGYTHMEFKLETGRTHQIRVHMAATGHPIIGDLVYGAKKDIWSLDGQCLHASMLTLKHPTTGENMVFTAELPDYFTDVLKKIEKRV